MSISINYEVKNRIAFITINRPDALNALTVTAARELGEAWLKFKDDDSALVGIITGSGDRAFCVGYEVTPEALTISSAQLSTVTVPTTHSLWKPTIAAIKGYCLAGGWWIAQECDIRIASDDAEFGITQVNWGLMPAFTASLSKYLPPGLALELLLVGERIKASRAYEIGFVNKLVSRSQVMATAVELAERIKRNAPVAVRKSKELFYKGITMDDQTAADLTWKLFAENDETADSREGIEAYLQRRKPKYQGF